MKYKQNNQVGGGDSGGRSTPDSSGQHVLPDPINVEEAQRPATGASEAVLILRRWNFAPDPSDGRGVVAMERHQDADQQKVRQDGMRDYCRDCLQHIVPDDPELYSYGTELLKHVELKRDRYWIAMMFGLHRVDDATLNACLAALLATLATAVGPAQLQTAKFAIAAFIHAHPKFAKFAAKTPAPAPFGKGATDYTVANMGSPPFEPDDPEES